MKSIASMVLALAATAIAAPTPQDQPPKDAAQITHLYTCTDAGFKGACTNLEVKLGECYGVGDAWNDKISSVAPDNGTFCAAYPDYECSGRAFPFTHPGIWDLAHYKKVDDTISSYRCDALGGFDEKDA